MPKGPPFIILFSWNMKANDITVRPWHTPSSSFRPFTTEIEADMECIPSLRKHHNWCYITNWGNSELHNRFIKLKRQFHNKIKGRGLVLNLRPPITQLHWRWPSRLVKLTTFYIPVPTPVNFSSSWLIYTGHSTATQLPRLVVANGGERQTNDTDIFSFT